MSKQKNYKPKAWGGNKFQKHKQKLSEIRLDMILLRYDYYKEKSKHWPLPSNFVKINSIKKPTN